MYSLQKFLFQAVLNELDAPAIIVMADAPLYTIVASNNKYHENTTIPAHELYGKGIKDIYAYLKAGQNHYALLIAGLQQAFESETKVILPIFSYEQISHGQQPVYQDFWQMEISPLANESGKLNYLLLLIKPVSIGETNPSDHQFSSLPADKRVTELNESSKTLTLRNIELEKQLYTRTTGFLIAQAATEYERDQVNQLFMQAPASIAVLSGEDLIIELVNPHFQELFTSILHLGMATAVAVPEILHSPVWQILQDVYRTGETFTGKELCHPMPAQLSEHIEKKYFNFIYQARRNQQQEIDGILIFAFDVTENVLAKRAIEAREKQNSLILNALPQIAWTNTVDGTLTFINQRFIDFTGENLEKILIAGWINLIHIDDRDAAKATFDKILKGNVQGEFEIRKRQKDGNFHWFLTRLAPISDKAGQVLFWIGTSTNIDEIKQLQHHKDEFIDLASHQLKTPLTSLKVSLQLIYERKESLSSAVYTDLYNRALISLDKVLAAISSSLTAAGVRHDQN